jgi:hypothetical protein
VIVHTVTAWPSSMISASVPDLLRRLGGVTIPWRQAVSERFDLAVAAWDGLLEQVHAPVLTVSHGVGAGKYLERWDGNGPEAPREASAPARARLVYRGRVIPSGIIVPTRRQLCRLRTNCPEAAGVAVVGGDPCFDRLTASLPLRDAYRHAAGTAGRRLVVVSSTWGPGSLMNTRRDLIQRLMEELSAAEYQLAAVIHPNAWQWHGTRQVGAWLADSVRRGLMVVPPEDGWRALLAAADLVIGDHSSVSCYAAGAGTPVILGCYPDEHIAAGTPPAVLGQLASRLRLDEPAGPQLRQAAEGWLPQSSSAMRAEITDVPGRSAHIIRSVMYRLMSLAEPATPPLIPPVAEPAPILMPPSARGRA